MNNSLIGLIGSTEKSFAGKTSTLDFKTEAHFASQQLSKNNFVTETALKNPASLQAAMINVAAIGLSLNPANKEAYLVPRDNAIHLDVSYTGLIKLATDTGSILWVQSKIVHDNDTFSDNGAGEKPTHLSNTFKDPGKAIGVYCVAKTVDGDYLTTTMSAEEIEAVRQTSKAAMSVRGGAYSPWSTFPEEMWKKVVIKRAAKTWPRTNKDGSAVLNEAIHVLNEHEGNVFEAVTEKHRSEYLGLVEGDDNMAFYCFFQNLEIEQRIQLQSEYVRQNAPDRQKGVFTAGIEEKLADGRKTAFEYVDRLIDARESLDASAEDELLNELNEFEKEFVEILISGKN